MKYKKDNLCTLYMDEKLNQKEIAKIWGISQSWVCILMKQFGIPSRTAGESQKGKPKWGGHRKCPWISVLNKNQWKNPEYRQRMIKKMKGRPSWIKGLPKEMHPRFGKRNTFKCKVCGKIFQAPLHKKRKYCSSKCQGIDYRQRFKGRIVTWGDKLSIARKKNNPFNWLNKDPSFQRKRMKALASKPTKPERILMTLIERNNLPFRYVGDGEVIIGTLNPDFIHNNGENKIIEVFGRVFHDPETSFFSLDWKRQVFGRLAYYGQFGYDCLILWDNEINDENKVVGQIKSFLGRD